MTGPQQRPTRPLMRRRQALLVLGVLVGLLGMHGLAPTGGLHAHERAGTRYVAAVAVTTPYDDCPEGGACPGDGDCGGGHLQHADSKCVSGAVNGTPAMPALVPDPVAEPVRADAVRSYTAAAPDGARAPPSLAELQLLRI